MQGVEGGRKGDYISINRMLNYDCDSPRTSKQLGILFRELVRVLCGIGSEVRDPSFGGDRVNV